MSNYDNLVEIPTEEYWGLRLFADPNYSDVLRQIQLDDLDDIVNRINSINNDVYYLGIDGEDELELWSDYTTGIDFEHEYDGGGYIISIGYTTGVFTPAKIICECDIEWDDSHAIEAGYADERRDENNCLSIGLQIMQKYFDTL